VTISLSKAVVDAIDQGIDGIKVRNRSQAIELALEQYTIPHRKLPKKFVVIAGGSNVLDRVPILFKALKAADTAQITEAYLMLGAQGGQVKKNLDVLVAEKLLQNIQITYVQSNAGSAGALREIAEKLHQPFFVLDSTTDHNLDFGALYAQHTKHQPAVTAAIKPGTNFDGLYLFEPEVIHVIPEGFSMIQNDLFPTLMKQARLLLYPILTN
jgi:NDP-sugar pyrophosphorylase family protein